MKSATKPLPLRVGSLAIAVLFLTALIPPSALADHRFAGTNFVEVRAEESQVAVYDEKGNLRSVTTTGKIIANNTESRTLQNVRIDLTNISGTNLTSPRTVNLPPGESQVAIYSVNAGPRLVLSEEWKSVTYQQTIEEFRNQGLISDATAARYLSNLKRVFFGTPNTLEFNITIENRGPNATNVTLTDLLPDALANPSLVSVTVPGAYATANLAYNAATDSITIPRFPSGTSTTLILRGTLPAVTNPVNDFLNLSKTTTASYEIRVEATQGFVQPVSPEVKETLDALQGVFNNTTRDRADLATLTPNLAPAAGVLDAAVAAKDATRMDAALPYIRGQLEGAAKVLANLSGGVTREGALLARLLELLNVSVSQSDIQARVGQIASQGLPSNLTRILQAEGFTSADLAQLQQFIASNAASLGSMNLSQAYAFAGQKYFEAAEGYGLASFKGLENAVYVNKTLGRTKSPIETTLANIRLVVCPFTFPWGAGYDCPTDVAPVTTTVASITSSRLTYIKEGLGYRYTLANTQTSGVGDTFDLTAEVKVIRLSDGQTALDSTATAHVVAGQFQPVDFGEFDGQRLRWTWADYSYFPGTTKAPSFNGVYLGLISSADPELAAMNSQAVSLRSDLASLSSGASAATDFAKVRSEAAELSDLSFQLASRSGQFSYADLYNSSHNAKLAALRGLSGDPEGAAGVLRTIPFSPHLVAWLIPAGRFLALDPPVSEFNLTVGIASWRGDAASGTIRVEVSNGTGIAGTVACPFQVPATSGPTPVENQTHNCAVPGTLLNGTGIHALRVWLAPDGESVQSVDGTPLFVQIGGEGHSIAGLPAAIQWPAYSSDVLINSVTSYFSRYPNLGDRPYHLRADILDSNRNLIAQSSIVSTTLPEDSSDLSATNNRVQLTFSFPSPPRVNAFTQFYVRFVDADTGVTYAGIQAYGASGGTIAGGICFCQYRTYYPQDGASASSSYFNIAFSTSSPPPGPTPTPTPTPTPSPTSSPTPTPTPTSTPTPTPSPTTATLYFTSTPSGASVYANSFPPYSSSQFLGTAPFNLYPSGSCSGCAVEFRLGGYASLVKVFDYSAGEFREVHADLAVSPGVVQGLGVDVRLNNLPDCVVTVGSVTQTVTSGCSFYFPYVPPGSQTVTIRSGGLQVFSTTLNVPAGGTAYLGGVAGVGTVVVNSVEQAVRLVAEGMRDGTRKLAEGVYGFYAYTSVQVTAGAKAAAAFIAGTAEPASCVASKFAAELPGVLLDAAISCAGDSVCSTTFTSGVPACVGALVRFLLPEETGGATWPEVATMCSPVLAAAAQGGVDAASQPLAIAVHECTSGL
ncbi:MAG: hypothetical protein QXQ87_09020 [Halobacteria archaeon]